MRVRRLRILALGRRSVRLTRILRTSSSPSGLWRRFWRRAFAKSAAVAASRRKIETTVATRIAAPAGRGGRYGAEGRVGFARPPMLEVRGLPAESPFAAGGGRVGVAPGDAGRRISTVAIPSESTKPPGRIGFEIPLEALFAAASLPLNGERGKKRSFRRSRLEVLWTESDLRGGGSTKLEVIARKKGRGGLGFAGSSRPSDARLEGRLTIGGGTRSKAKGLLARMTAGSGSAGRGSFGGAQGRPREGGGGRGRGIFNDTLLDLCLLSSGGLELLE